MIDDEWVLHLRSEIAEVERKLSGFAETYRAHLGKVDAEDLAEIRKDEAMLRDYLNGLRGDLRCALEAE